MDEPLAKARDFATNAELYVYWFDQAVSNEAPRINMRRLHELLGLLQAAAARLTGGTPNNGDLAGFENRQNTVGILTKTLPIDEYSVIFDPLEMSPPKPVMATIADDLTDIYRNVMEGLVEYRAGRVQNALWQWHFTYYSHWGRHLSHAQTAIYQYLSAGNFI